MKGQKQVNIDVNTLKNIPCSCGCLEFTQIVQLKYISKLQSPDGNEGTVHLAGLVCVACGKSDKEAIRNFHEQQKKEFDSRVVQIGSGKQQ